jgi:hypothetical protein
MGKLCIMVVGYFIHSDECNAIIGYFNVSIFYTDFKV